MDKDIRTQDFAELVSMHVSGDCDELSCLVTLMNINFSLFVRSLVYIDEPEKLQVSVSQCNLTRGERS